MKGSVRGRGLRAPVAVVIAAALLLLASCAAQAQTSKSQAAPGRERTAAMVPLLELQDMIYATRVARGAMTAPQADAALRAQAAAWRRQAPTISETELIGLLRSEAAILLDHAALRAGAAARWPSDRPPDVYAALASERLGQLGRSLRDAPATQTALSGLLVGMVEVIGWTEGRARLDTAHNPFAASYERAMLAAVPSPAQPANSPPPSASPTPPPPLPPGTLKLAYFGLFDDRVGPRGIAASGKPDGRFVLTIDVGKLTSRELAYIGLQAMDANSRPVGPIWHTRDSDRPLLLVVAGDQWLNTRHVGGLAILEAPEVDLILFADNAPEATAINAFIVEAGFADGSVARQLAKSR
mgnify:CR=1 FL=1